MKNIATTWPAMQGVDLTTPAEIEAKARHLAGLPTKEARDAARSKIETQHNDNIARMIVSRAQAIYRGRR